MNSADTLAQAAMLRELLHAHCFPHAAGRIDWIETHISTILLAGEYAYKFKKPVSFGFLDFSTLELRRHYCEEELRLNRRLAPSLYIDVVAIVRIRDGLAVAACEASDAIEYGVRMRRFAQSALLDHMLANGELTAHHLDTLAETVAAFHAQIASNLASEFGTPESIALPMRQNFSQIGPLLESEGEIADLRSIEAWSISRHEELSTLMRARKHGGFVRECHGDLHLGNIIWSEGEIHIFDCIEFNPGLRWIDVSSEIAFTVMDLTSRGRPDWGARFLNYYLEITGDYACLRLISYYLVYRAMVRAKVARIRATQGERALDQEALGDYAEHMRLAASFMAPRRAGLIITRGVSGVGKTTVTQPVLESLGAVRLRSDVVRKSLHGLKQDARSESALGSGLYTDAASHETYAELLRLAAQVMEAGYPVIVDATFLRRSQRDAFQALAMSMGVPFLLLDCHAEPDELRRRIVLRQASANDASEATVAVLEWQLQHDEPLETQEMPFAIDIDTQSMVPSELVAIVRQRLAS